MQQAQVAYQEAFDASKIAYQDICNSNTFCLDKSGALLANTCYFLAIRDGWLLGYLNSKLAWFNFAALTNIARGGYLRLRSDFVEQLTMPDLKVDLSTALELNANTCTVAATQRFTIIAQTRNRIATDLGAGAALSRKLEHWHELDFTAFRVEVKRLFKTEIPVKERAAWEAYLKEEAAKVKTLSVQIVTAEAEINRLVYDAFELSSEEISLLENSMHGQI